MYATPQSTATISYYGQVSGFGSHTRVTSGAAVARTYAQSLEGDQPPLGRHAVRLTAAGPQILGSVGLDAEGLFADEATSIDAVGNAYGESTIGSTRLGVTTAAVRWPAGGTAPTVLNAPTSTSDGISSAFVHNTNAAGLAVGSALWMRNDQISGTQAVAWAPGSTSPLALPSLSTTIDAANISEARYVNASGTIAGTSTFYDNGVAIQNQPVRWLPGASAPERLALSPAVEFNFFEVVKGIDGAGNVVGNAPGSLNAYRWDAGSSTATSLRGVGESGGVVGAWVDDVNAAGTAVGASEYYVGDTNFGNRALKWLPGSTTPIILEAPDLIDGATFAEALCINDLGYAGGYDNGAILWKPDGSAVRLMSLLPADSGWVQLSKVVSISNDGWITGDGFYDPDGDGPMGPGGSAFLMHVDLANLPEPACLASILLLLPTYSRRRH